jgi:hypothetical protein
MMAQCVIPVDNNQYLVFVGNVQNVQTLTCVQSVTMATNTISDIGFTE